MAIEHTQIETTIPAAAGPRMGAKVASALVVAQGNVRAVEKDAQNQFHKYKYASSESMIQEGRSVLSSAGLALLCADTEISRIDNPPEGKERVTAILNVTLTLVHKEGECFSWTRDWPCIETNGRPLDKAVGGALTTCLAYTLRDLLLIPRDDDQAAMDRREPEAGQQVTEQAEQPARSAGPNPAAVLLEQIKGGLKPEGLTEGLLAPLSADMRMAITLIARAYAAPTHPEFLSLAATIRKDLAHREDIREWCLREIKPVHERLVQPKAAA